MWNGMNCRIYWLTEAFTSEKWITACEVDEVCVWSPG